MSRLKLGLLVGVPLFVGGALIVAGAAVLCGLGNALVGAGIVVVVTTLVFLVSCASHGGDL